MLWIGITGPIGSGKSAVGAMLTQRGFHVVDADRVVHGLLAPGGAAVPEVLRTFGPSVDDSAGGVDRRALGRVVFRDAAKLALLEGVLHPLVRVTVAAEKSRCMRTGLRAAFYEVPLLFEKNMEPQFDRIWVVSAPVKLRQQRFCARTGLPEAEFLARAAKQLDPAIKEARATIVLKNGGDLSALASEVDRALKASGLPASANP